jgi:hypothetical protein
MKQELPGPAVMGTFVIVLAVIIGLFVFLNRPEPIPQGKIDPNLSAPQVKTGRNSRFAPAVDNTEMPLPEHATLASPGGT